MTGNEVRDLGYLAWKDPYAWMEQMKGKRWKDLLAHEKHNFNKLAKQVIHPSKQIQQEITDVYQYLELPPYLIGGGSVQITYTESKEIKWSWVCNPSKQIICNDIDVVGDHAWCVVEDDNHSYKNKIVCMNAKGKVLWIKNQVSSQVAVIGDLCYYVMVTDYFNTVEIRACNAKTGKNERILYREPSKERDLTLLKETNRTLYFQNSSTTDSKLFRINGYSVIQLYKNSMFQLPVGYMPDGYMPDGYIPDGYIQTDCVFTRQTTTSKWIAKGEPICDWILPQGEIQYVSLQSGHILTIFEGSRTIWFCAPHKKPSSIFTIKAGEITPLPWSDWENNQVISYIIESPFSIPYMIHIIGNTIVNHSNSSDHIKRPIRFHKLEVHQFHTSSKDGTKVPYILIKQANIRPKALLVYVYGAYGDPSLIEWPYKKWYPLLSRKWAIVYALVRGGGDSNMKWAEAGRKQNRHLSVDDYEVVIRDSQRILKINARRTVIYGRSAGGVPVGAMVSRYPDGTLMGASYTEVPYVDVLRTSSNPSLPLTVEEYKEFGNPYDIMNFKELLSVSPINTLPADGAPGVFVLTRVGLLDRQVYAYESFKWIQKLRGNMNELGYDPKGKYVIFDEDEVHTYQMKHYIPTHALDLAILDAHVSGTLFI